MTIYTCDFCNKTFKNKSGLSGHRYRSHINLDKQRENGLKGNAAMMQKYPEGTMKNHKHTDETIELLSKLRCDSLNENAFYSKRHYINGIKLDSSYEYTLALDLNENNIEWTRPKSLKYVDGQGKNRWYLPDFYLPKYDVYLDPKNDFLIQKHAEKIKNVLISNNIILLVLNKNELSWNKIKQKLNL